MGHIYFVRHGQTEWNLEHKICGITDVPLTEKGHAQAMETGEKILASGITADEILHSPLQRAVDTARHISEITGIPMREEPRLTEQNFGRFEGTNKDLDEFKQARSQFAQDFGGGESMLRLAQRIFNLLDELAEESEEKTYILVAHNGIGRMVHAYFYNMSNQEYAFHTLNNAEIVRYAFP